MSSKYSNILTMVLIVIIVAIVGICFYYGYDYYTQESGEKQTQKTVEEFKNTVKNKVIVSNKKPKTNTVTSEIPENITDFNALYENTNTVEEEPVVEEPVGEVEEPAIPEPEKQYLEGYEVVGTIKIPKTGIEYPVLSQVTKKSLETSVAILYGPGVNQPGNTVIVGHNYRNQRFFSNNDKLANGDTVILTDVYGNVVTYVIYNMYYTSPDDADYMIRPVDDGVREVSLSTCNDDSTQRLIIWAREQ